MKLRLIKQKNGVYMYCPNGTILQPTEKDLAQLLTSFTKPQRFKGTAGSWSANMADMEEGSGETLAYVDDTYKLVILNEQAFAGLFKPEIKYISASEYAAMYDKCKATVKNLCVAGKLPGAYKTSAGWLIPDDAPYPQDGRRRQETE